MSFIIATVRHAAFPKISVRRVPPLAGQSASHTMRYKGYCAKSFPTVKLHKQTSESIRSGFGTAYTATRRNALRFVPADFQERQQTMFSKSPRNEKDGRLARYDTIIVHCTATQPIADVDAAWVNREHLRRGFKNGNGYHAVITRRGEWEDRDDGFLTRPIEQMGAHVGDCGPGWNERSFGISLAGGVDSHNDPEANYSATQLDTLEEGILRFIALHPAPETVVLMGHRDLIRLTSAPPKACPCFDVQPWWTELGNAPMFTARARSVAPFKPEHGDDATATKNNTLLLPSTYKVADGDSLWRISELFGITPQRIRTLNGKKDDVIKVGELLKLK